MSKLVVSVVLALMFIGISVYILNYDNGGLNGAIINGHEELKKEFRKYNFSTN